MSTLPKKISMIQTKNEAKEVFQLLKKMLLETDALGKPVLPADIVARITPLRHDLEAAIASDNTQAMAKLTEEIDLLIENIGDETKDSLQTDLN